MSDVVKAVAAADREAMVQDATMAHVDRFGWFDGFGEYSTEVTVADAASYLEGQGFPSVVASEVAQGCAQANDNADPEPAA